MQSNKHFSKNCLFFKKNNKQNVYVFLVLLAFLERGGEKGLF